jgi:hypothetical protein
MSDKTLVKLSAGSLLLAQRDANASIAAAVNAHIDRAAAQAAKHQDNERKAALLVLLLLVAKAMAADARTAILGARTGARDASRARLNAELRAGGIVLAAHQWVVAHRGDEDDAHAVSSADSLAGQWRGLAVASVMRARRLEKPLGEAIESTRAPMVARVDRTASTEVAQAFADEHSRALADVIDFDKTYRDGALADKIESEMVREWVAMLDACDRCWPHDGEQVGINESFGGGDEPGFMHARCRCYEILTSPSMARAVAA